MPVNSICPWIGFPMTASESRRGRARIFTSPLLPVEMDCAPPSWLCWMRTALSTRLSWWARAGTSRCRSSAMSRPNDPSRSVTPPQGVTDEALDWQETVAAVCKGPHLHLGSADYAFAEDGEMGCTLISEAREAASRGAGGSGGERLAERLHGDS